MCVCVLEVAPIEATLSEQVEVEEAQEQVVAANNKINLRPQMQSKLASNSVGCDDDDEDDEHVFTV